MNNQRGRVVGLDVHPDSFAGERDIVTHERYNL